MNSKKVLYHITDLENLDSILREGIKSPDGSGVWLTDRPLIWLKALRDYKKIKNPVIVEVEIPLDEYINNLADDWGEPNKFFDFDYDEFSDGAPGQIRYNGSIPKEKIVGYYIVSSFEVEIKRRRKP